MSRYRTIDACFHFDAEVARLSRPKNANGHDLFVHLLIGPQNTALPGIYYAFAETLARELRWSVADFMEVWENEIARKPLALADWEFGLVWLPSRLKFCPPANANIVASWEDTWKSLPQCPLKDQARDAFAAYFRDPARGENGKKMLLAFEAYAGTSSAQVATNIRRNTPQPLRSKGGTVPATVPATRTFDEIPPEQTGLDRANIRRNPPTVEPTFDEIIEPKTRTFDEIQNAELTQENAVPVEDTANIRRNYDGSANGSPNGCPIQEQYQEQKQEQNLRSDADASQRDEGFRRMFATNAPTVDEIPDATKAANTPIVVEALDQTTRSERISGPTSAPSRHPGYTAPPHCQTTLVWPGIEPTFEAKRRAGRPARDIKKLRHPELCRQVVNVLNEMRAIVCRKALRGQHPASDETLRPMDDRLSELTDKFACEQEATAFLCDVVRARAWQLGKEPDGHQAREQWKKGFRFLNYMALFTIASGARQGGWGMSEVIRSEWMDEGKPAPSFVRSSNDDLRKGAIRPAYDPADFANVASVQAAHIESMRQAYREKMISEGKDPDEELRKAP